MTFSTSVPLPALNDILYSSTPEQFKPVPVLVEDPVDACIIPARVSCSGMVASIDKEHHSFILFPTQNITACADPQTVAVCTVLEKGPKWPNPVARLPSPYKFVGFIGKLAHFEDNIGPTANNLHFHAVITLDSITYLRANYSMNTVSSHSLTLQSQNADTIALKTHVLKYSHGGKHLLALSGKIRTGKVMTDSDIESAEGEEEHEANE